MTKFRSLSIQNVFADVDSGGAAAYAQGISHFVAVEVDDGSWCALHATSEDHAKTLANEWVNNQGARGASCWTLNADGSHSRKAFYSIFEEISDHG